MNFMFLEIKEMKMSKENRTLFYIRALLLLALLNISLNTNGEEIVSDIILEIKQQEQGNFKTLSAQEANYYARNKIFELKAANGGYVGFKSLMLSNENDVLRLVANLPKKMSVSDAWDYIEELKLENDLIIEAVPNIKFVGHQEEPEPVEPDNCSFFQRLGLSVPIVFANCDGTNYDDKTYDQFSTNLQGGNFLLPLANTFIENTKRVPISQWYLHDQSRTCTNNDGSCSIDVPIIASANIYGAWDNGYIGLAENITAILDAGVDVNRIELKDKFVRINGSLVGYNVFTQDNNVSEGSTPEEEECLADDPPFSHGSFVTGLFGADRESSLIAGADIESSIIPVKVLRLSCMPRDNIGDLSSITDGLNWLISLKEDNPDIYNRIRVINLSLGSENIFTSCPSSLQNPINTLANDGKSIVISAGNSNYNAASFLPGNCLNTISVASVDFCSHRASYSNFGSSINISTVGGMISSGCGVNEGSEVTYIYDSTNTATAMTSSFYGFDSIGREENTIFKSSGGTSYSAPLVSATVSLMHGVSRDITWAGGMEMEIVEPLSVTEVYGILSYSARNFVTYGNGLGDFSMPCSQSDCGYGLLDAARALEVTSDYLPCKVTSADLCTVEASEVRDEILRLGATINKGLVNTGGEAAVEDDNSSGGDIGWIFLLLLIMLGVSRYKLTYLFLSR